MRITKLVLENIRSYTNETIEFPEGSVLLSGDIGAGKSSLLLAIEFALFGIRQGELSGDELLREGEKNGSVMLTFTIDDKTYCVKRTLQRGASYVAQKTGSFGVDDVWENLSANELKARVLQTIGYPEDLVSKHRSYIYRYTVYTPQEMMKEIIYASEDQRLETLRNIFGINKYKLIRDNTSVLRADIRGFQREFSGMAQGFDEDKQQLAELNETIQKLQKDFTQIDNVYKAMEKKITEQRQKWKQYREQLQMIGKMQEQKATLTARLEEADKQIQKTNEQIQTLRQQINDIEKLKRPTDLTEEELEGKKSTIQQQKEQYLKNPQGINDDIDKQIQETKDIELKINECDTKKNTLSGKIGSLQDAIKELQDAGDICPICGSSLSEEHKQKEITKNQQQIQQIKSHQEQLAKQKEQLNQIYDTKKKVIEQTINALIEGLTKQYNAFQEINKQLQTYQQKISQKNQLHKQIQEDNQKIKDINENKLKNSKELQQLTEKLKQYQDVQKKETETQQALEAIQEKFRTIEKQHTSMKIDIKNGQQNISTLTTTIKKKEHALKLRTIFSAYDNWLDTFLNNLAATIERHFMIHLQKKFNSVFGRWYQKLIDDESLNVRVDDHFTPIIERGGYETMYYRLSGGEKTSVALAYRLALNTVINTMIEEIKTRDIVILDEPTDGFSSHQLDKVRDVINELGMKQTILVSHEQKMESYVDNIINIQKENGVSKLK
jgi:DNA repair protein SbcC/Rad50